MITPIGYKINNRIKPHTDFTGFKDLKYHGKILYDGQDRVTQAFMMPLKSGKRLFLDYKNGLLKRAGISGKDESWVKKYFYTGDEKLIRVEKDGVDIFTKDCGYIDSDTISYYESINNGAIEIGYDTSGKKATAVVKPKLVKSFFTYIGNTINEMRYKITNVEVLDGNSWRIYPGEAGNYEIESKFAKRISKNLQNGHTTITTYDKNNMTTMIEKDKTGKLVSVIKTKFNKAEKPIWTAEFDKNGIKIFEKNTSYDDAGNKIHDKIYNKAEGEFIKDITYDKIGNITETQVSDTSGNIYSTIKNKYNANGDIINTKNINSNGAVTEEENFIYDKNNKLLESHYKGSGTDDDDILEGHYYYKNGVISKEIEHFNSGIEESYYRKGKIVKYVLKDTKGNVQKIFTQKYKAGKIKTTTRTDGDNNIVYTIDHSYKYNDQGEAHTKIFKKPNGEFIVREVIITTGNGVNSIFQNKEGEIINPAPYLQYIYD